MCENIVPKPNSFLPRYKEEVSSLYYLINFDLLTKTHAQDIKKTLICPNFPFFLSECSVSAIADLAFLVDGSWSVGRENFKHIRSFIASLAGAFDIGEDKTRVAVVQYSTDTRTEFPLTQYTRRGNLLQAINSLPYKGGNTMTGIQKPKDWSID